MNTEESSSGIILVDNYITVKETLYLDVQIAASVIEIVDTDNGASDLAIKLQ